MNTQNLLMDKHLVLQFKRGLLEQHRELSHAIEKAEKEIRDLAGPVPLDAIDLSCFTASKDSLFLSASQNRSRLHLIQHALERLNDGSFGICVDCGGQIGLRRLQALPWASHCLQCQENSEARALAGNATLQVSLGSAPASGT